MKPSVYGPLFQIESDKAIVLLGHSERKGVGDDFVTALDERHIFEDIDVFTLNRCAAVIGRASVQKAMEHSTVITHSAAIMRVPKALQIVAVNPPEPVPLPTLVKRGVVDIPRDPIIAEDGRRTTGFLDMVRAGVELVRSPITTVTTTTRIAGGYSATERLINGQEDFPAGRAMVHSELDTFGFSQIADLAQAGKAGVTGVMLPGHYHNEILFAPNRTLDQLTPTIFPENN